jgi:hypothetical protein
MGQGGLARFSFLLGAGLVMFMAAIVVIASLGFLMGWPLHPLTVWLAGLVVVVFARWTAGRSFPQAVPRTFVLLLLGIALILGLALALEWHFYDFSSDGQTYHTTGLVELTKGWNPLRDPPRPVGINVPLNVYSKGPWIAAAALYQLTGSLEAAKTFNLIVLVAAFLIAFATLETITPLPRVLNVALAGVLAVNPISVTQASSLYVDGQLASLLSILLCLGLLVFRSLDPILLVMFGTTVILATNIKLSALAYVLVIGVAIVVWRRLVTRQRGTQLALLFLASYGIGVFGVGFNPYVTNTLRYGSPMYPTNDWTTFLVATKNTPDNLAGKNTVHKLALSLFARSDLRTDMAERKLPFTFAARELAAFESGETRVAGFGPLFSGAIVMSSALFLLIVGYGWAKQSWQWDWLFMTGVVGLTVLVNPEAWWARYAPQLWLVPIFITAVGALSEARALRWASYTTILVLAADCLLVTGVHSQALYRKTARLRQQLAEIATAPPPTTVYFANFEATRVRFDERGVQYVAVATLPCKEFITLVGSESQVCLPWAAQRQP